MNPDPWPGIAHLQDEASHARDVTFVKLCIFIALLAVNAVLWLT